MTQSGQLLVKDICSRMPISIVNLRNSSSEALVWVAS